MTDPLLIFEAVLDFVTANDGLELKTLSKTQSVFSTRRTDVGGVAFERKEGGYETITAANLRRCVECFNQSTREEREHPSTYPSDLWVTSYVAPLLLAVSRASFGKSAPARDWSDSEVTATVQDYLSMLKDELNGVRYNKTNHRRNLLAQLDGRSGSAIEKKHANISAVLLEHGYPCIEGYKPLSRYQRRLGPALEAAIGQDQALLDLLLRSVSNHETKLPIADDLFSVVATPPAMPLRPETKVPRARITAGHIDYLALEAQNAALGRAGELFALRYERHRLAKLGLEKLVSKVEHVSESVGDGAGFDIRSFNNDGSDRFIEVKTTSFSIHTPFFVTPNELAFSQAKKERYHLYRFFKFRTEPQQYQISGAIDGAFRLSPSVYQARR